jgi:flagellin
MSVTLFSPSSLTVQRYGNHVQSSLTSAIERMSSGIQLKQAKDNAAGLGISQILTLQKRGLDASTKAINDQISVAETMDGSLASASDVLLRMRSLITQASNATLSAIQRTSIANELVQLGDELNQIAERSAFNGKRLLSGAVSGLFEAVPNIDGLSLGLGTQLTDQIAVKALDPTNLNPGRYKLNVESERPIAQPRSVVSADISAGERLQELTVSGTWDASGLADQINVTIPLMGRSPVTVSYAITQADISAGDAAGAVAPNDGSAGSSGLAGSDFATQAQIAQSLAGRINAVSMSMGLGISASAELDQVFIGGPALGYGEPSVSTTAKLAGTPGLTNATVVGRTRSTGALDRIVDISVRDARPGNIFELTINDEAFRVVAQSAGTQDDIYGQVLSDLTAALTDRFGTLGTIERPTDTAQGDLGQITLKSDLGLGTAKMSLTVKWPGSEAPITSALSSVLRSPLETAERFIAIDPRDVQAGRIFTLQVAGQEFQEIAGDRDTAASISKRLGVQIKNALGTKAIESSASMTIDQQGSSNSIEYGEVRFRSIASGESVTVNGLVFTANEDLSADEVARAFKGLSNGFSAASRTQASHGTYNVSTTGSLGRNEQLTIGPSLTLTVSGHAEVSQAEVTAALSGLSDGSAGNVSPTRQILEYDFAGLSLMQGDSVTIAGITVTSTGVNPLSGSEIALLLRGMDAGDSIASPTDLGGGVTFTATGNLAHPFDVSSSLSNSTTIRIYRRDLSTTDFDVTSNTAASGVVSTNAADTGATFNAFSWSGALTGWRSEQIDATTVKFIETSRSTASNGANETVQSLAFTAPAGAISRGSRYFTPYGTYSGTFGAQGAGTPEVDTSSSVYGPTWASFQALVAGDMVPDLPVSTTAGTSPSVFTTQGSDLNRTEIQTFSFEPNGLAKGDTATIGGLSFTAARDLTPQEAASAFAGLSDQAISGPATELGTYRGVFSSSGWNTTSPVGQNYTWDLWNFGDAQTTDTLEPTFPSRGGTTTIQHPAYTSQIDTNFGLNIKNDSGQIALTEDGLTFGAHWGLGTVDVGLRISERLDQPVVTLEAFTADGAFRGSESIALPQSSSKGENRLRFATMGLDLSIHTASSSVNQPIVTSQSFEFLISPSADSETPPVDIRLGDLNASGKDQRLGFVQLGEALNQISLGNASLDESMVERIHTALTIVESAVTRGRSQVGALQNQLEHQISNLQGLKLGAEASLSRIMDTDFGQETAKLASLQILQQASTATMAQVNQMPNIILTLLQ